MSEAYRSKSKKENIWTRKLKGGYFVELWFLNCKTSLLPDCGREPFLVFHCIFSHWCFCHDSDLIRKPESTSKRRGRKRSNRRLIKASFFCMKIHQYQHGGQQAKNYYHRYEMFLLNTQMGVKLCCSCLSIYILIRPSVRGHARRGEGRGGGVNIILESCFNISAAQVSLRKFTEHFDVGAADYDFY